MVDTQKILDALPHYAAMLLLVFGVLWGIEAAFGDQSFWLELLIVVLVVFLYRPVVLKLGIAPPHWEQQYRERVSEK